jgi:hypothetical protein
MDDTDFMAALSKAFQESSFPAGADADEDAEATAEKEQPAPGD